MMKSNDINLFFVSFEAICALLLEVGIEFYWGEKEKIRAKDAWYKYNNLTSEQKTLIGRKMVSLIEVQLISLIENILDESIERQVKKIVVEIVSSLGEVKVFEFNNIDNALEFLGQDDLKNVFLITDSLSLFDPPPIFDE